MIALTFILFSFLVTEAQIEVGQRVLREEFHDAVRLNKVEEFLTTHNFVDVEELYRAQFEGDSENVQRALESIGKPTAVSSLLHQTRTIWSHRPWHINDLATSVTELFSSIRTRWEDALPFASFFLLTLAIPLALAALPILLLFLYTSLPGLLPDFRIRQEWVFNVLLALTLVATAFFSAWWALLLLLVGLSIIYIRRPSGLILGYCLLALTPLFSAITTLTSRLGELCSASFAIDEGRTRLEYSRDSLEFLGLLDRSIWSAQNNDFKASETWRKLAEDNAEKRFFEVYLASLNKSSQESLVEYQALSDVIPESTALKFNLMTLYTKTQDLVRADEMRGKLSSNTVDQLSEQADRTRGNLVSHEPLDHGLVISRAFDQVLTEFKRHYWETSSWLQKLFYLLAFLGPWVFLGICLIRRRSAHGTCQYTGEPTASPLHDESTAYQTWKLKQDVYKRQQIESQMRMYSSLRSSRIRLWGWFVPEARRLVWERKPLHAWIWLSVIFTLAINSLPYHSRDLLFSRLGFDLVAPYSAKTFAVWMLVLAVALYVWSVFKNQRGES